jgi:hypothetical protein
LPIVDPFEPKQTAIVDPFEQEERPAKSEAPVKTGIDRLQDNPFWSIPKAASRHITDAAVSLAKGVVGVPEAVVGLLDIPTKGYAGKMSETIGIKFKDTQDILDTLYSEEQQEANRKVREAKGFIPTVKAAIQNPSTIVNTAVESAPSVIGGGGLARGGLALLSKLPKIAQVLKGAATAEKILQAGGKLTPELETARRVAQTIYAAAGGAGEGAISAGQTAEEARQQNQSGTLTGKQIGTSAMSGALTGLFGFLGGKLAQRLGINDIDTLLASGSSAATKRGVLLRVIGSAISEGAFEELPQSMQEQVASNLNAGKPWDEGVLEAGATGMMAGGLMGAFGGAAGNIETPAVERTILPQDFFDQVRTALEAGTGSLDQLKETREAYASDPKADPDSLTHLDSFIQAYEAKLNASPEAVIDDVQRKGLDEDTANREIIDRIAEMPITSGNYINDMLADTGLNPKDLYVMEGFKNVKPSVLQLDPDTAINNIIDSWRSKFATPQRMGEVPRQWPTVDPAEQPLVNPRKDEGSTDILSGWQKPAQQIIDPFEEVPNVAEGQMRREAETEEVAAPSPEQEAGSPLPASTFEDMVAEAARWKGAATRADVLYGDDKKARLAHSRMTTKGDLDAYLMQKYGVDATTARDVSNELTAKNVPADEAARIEDFQGQPWADTAIAYRPPAPSQPPTPAPPTNEPQEEKKEAVAKATKKPAKKAPAPKTLLRLVQEHGGLSVQAMKRAGRKVKGEFLDNGLVGVFSDGKKGKGKYGLDVLYQRLTEEGLIEQAPEGWKGDDWLLDLLQQERRGVAVTIEKIEQSYKDDIIELEDKYGKDVVEARREEIEGSIEEEVSRIPDEEITRLAEDPDFVSEEDYLENPAKYEETAKEPTFREAAQIADDFSEGRYNPSNLEEIVKAQDKLNEIDSLVPEGTTVKIKTGFGQSILHKSTKNKGQYQISRFDKNGEAIGDSQYTNYEDAVHDFRHEQGSAVKALETLEPLIQKPQETAVGVGDELFDTGKTFSLSGAQPVKQGTFKPEGKRPERLIESERQGTDELRDRLSGEKAKTKKTPKGTAMFKKGGERPSDMGEYNGEDRHADIANVRKRSALSGATGRRRTVREFAGDVESSTQRRVKASDIQPVGELTRDQRKIVKEAQRLGNEIVFFDGKGTAALIGGQVFPDFPYQIFVNVNAPNVKSVIQHESFHSFALTSPAELQTLFESVADNLTGLETFHERINRARESIGLEPISLRVAAEEILADIAAGDEQIDKYVDNPKAVLAEIEKALFNQALNKFEGPFYLKTSDLPYSFSVPYPLKPKHTKADVEAMVEKFRRKLPNSGNIVVVENPLYFPIDLIERAGGLKEGEKVYGAYDPETDTTYIVSGAVESERHAAVILVHEIVGHRGITAILHPNQQQTVFEQIRRAYQDTEIGRQVIKDYGLDFENDQDRQTFSKELIAHLAETGEKPSLWNKVVFAIKRALQRLGITFKFTDADIKALIRESWKWGERQSTEDIRQFGDSDIAWMKKGAYEPKKTIKGYKIFRTLKTRPGEIFPLFLDATTPVPIGEWLIAKAMPKKTGFALRPGWHSGQFPEANQIRQTSTGKYPLTHVWAEVEIPADIDYQAQADKSPTKDIKGRIPENGYYRFHNPSQKNKMSVPWYISGAIKVNRIISEGERLDILRENGLPVNPLDETEEPKRVANVSFKKSTTSDTSDLPPYLAKWLNQAQKDKTKLHRESDNSAPPPVNEDPEKTHSWLSREWEALFTTITKRDHSTDLALTRKLLSSPEYWDHPVLAKIVRIFVRDRSELYHRLFWNLDNPIQGDKAVTEATRELKKTDPKGYKDLLWAIDYGDTQWKRNPKIPLDEQVAAYERLLRSKGLSDDVIKVWKLHRTSYDNALDLMTAQLRKLMEELQEKAKSGLALKEDLNTLEQLQMALASMEEWRGFYAPRMREQGSYVMRASRIRKDRLVTKPFAYDKTDSKHEYHFSIRSKTLFEDYITLTPDTASNFGLPSSEGVNYVMGKDKETGQYLLQSIRFKKDTFGEDQKHAADWWDANRDTIDAEREFIREHGGKYKMNRRMLEMKDQGWSVLPVEKMERLSEDIYQNLKTVDMAKAIDYALKQLKEGQQGPEAAQMALGFNEEVIELVSNMIKVRGYRSSMIHRGKGSEVVKGYIEDPQERYVRYINSVSGGISKAKVAQMATTELLGEYVGGERVGGIDQTKEPRAYATAQEYIKEQLRNIEPIDRAIGIAKSIATFKYLGFNLRSLGVNLTAIATTAPAAIHQYALDGKVGFFKINRALAESGNDYRRFMMGKKLDDETRSICETIKKEGWDDAQYVRDAQGELQKAGEHVWTKTMQAAMYLFGKSEQWNRGTTVLAAYRLARQQGKKSEEALELAKTASDKAHGIYGKATLPSWAMGGGLGRIGQMMYVYSKFGHNYTQMLYDLGAKKHNITALTWAIAAPLILAGGAAFPFKDEIVGILNGILHALGGITEAVTGNQHGGSLATADVERFVWDAVRKHLGDTAEVAGRHGLTGLAGVDIGGSVSIGVGIPTGLSDFAGAIGGVGEDVVKGAKYATRGQPGRAAEKLLPRAAENVVRAIRERRQGVTTEKGRRVWDAEGKPLTPSVLQTGARAIGFRSSEQATLSERRQEAIRQGEMFKDKRDALYEEYRAYRANPNRTHEQFERINRKRRTYNEQVRAQGLKGEVPLIDIDGLIRQAKAMGKPSKKERARLR